MTSNSLTPKPRAEIDPDSLTALSDDEMLEEPLDWCTYSQDLVDVFNQYRDKQRELHWMRKKLDRNLLRLKIQRAKREQGKMKTI
jgi:hypothetical protein